MDIPSVRPVDVELERFLTPYDPVVRALALETRALVLTVAPSAIELLYDSYNAVAIAFTFSGRMAEAFCHVAVYAGHVNLGFNRGAELPDPAGLLQGSGKLIRHVKVRRHEDLEEAYVREFLQLAVARASQPADLPPKTAAVVRSVSSRKRRPA